MRAAKESASYISTAGDLSPVVVNRPRGDSPRGTGTSAASAAGTASRNQNESEIGLIYSGESDDASDSKATPHPSGSPGADTGRARITGSGQHGGIMSNIFGSSDYYDESPPHASPSDTTTRGMMVVHPYITTSEVIRGIGGNTGVIAHARTNQETRDQNVLHHAPQVESPCMPLSKEINRLAGMTTERDRILLLYCSKICPPDSSTETTRADEELFTDAFFKHRWYNDSRVRDGKALVQG
uniref:Uncharacterized protein n=1 Tax=Peronospora matthiolae TaxID=2874970 RepID=A0AAV1UG60_9STRA